MNIVVVKFNVQFKKDGVLFLVVCFGLVEVGYYDGVIVDDLVVVEFFLSIFKEYLFGYERLKVLEVLVRMMWDVIEVLSLEKGDGGVFVFYYGN